MKILKIPLLSAVLIIAAFTGWHYYMKATWDHHLVGKTYLVSKPFYLGEDNVGKRHYLSEEKFLELAQQYNIPLYDVVAHDPAPKNRSMF